jgi:hypothetical protein
MEVVNNLPALFFTIIYQAETTLGQAQFPGNLHRHQVDMAKQFFIFRRYGRQIGYMLPGDN